MQGTNARYQKTFNRTIIELKHDIIIGSIIDNGLLIGLS